MIVFLKNVRDISFGRVFNNWRVATKRNLVLTGLTGNSFSQHHAATWHRSFSRLCLASTTSSIEKDKRIIESSTKESKSQACVIDGKSFLYMKKRSGDRIAPCGTPCAIGRTLDTDEPMRSFCVRPDK